MRYIRLIPSLLLFIWLSGCGASSTQKMAVEVKLGKSLLEAGEYSQAAQAFQRVLQIDAGHVQATYLRGQALEENKQYSQAYTHYERAYELSPAHTRAGESALRLELLGKHTAKATERLQTLTNFGLTQNRQIFWQAKLAMAKGDMGNALDLLLEIRGLKGAPTDVLLADATASLAMGGYERAQADIDQILRDNHEHYKARFLAISIVLAQGNNDVAEEMLKAMRISFPKNDEVMMRLAAVQMSQDKPKKAIANYQYILGLPGNHYGAILALGEIYAAKQNLAALTQLIGEMKVDSRAGEGVRFYLSGLAKLQLGEIDKAAEFLGRASKLLPKYALVWVAYGQSMLGQGKNARALTLFEKALQLNGDILLAKIQVARINALNGDYFQAETSLLNVLENRPCDIQAELILTKVYMIQDKPRQGLARVNKCISLVSQGSSVTVKNAFLAMKAELLLKLGSKQESLTILQGLAAEDAENKGYNNAIARVFISLGRAEEAKKVLAEGVSNHEMPAMVSLAMIYLAERKREEAERLFTQALSIDGDAFMANLQLGLIKLEAGDIVEAKKYLKRVLTQSPQDPLANQAFAIITQKEGDLSLAEDFYEKALLAKNDLALSQMGMAEIMLATGRSYAAAEHAEAALKVVKDSARALLALAVAKQRHGELDESEALFNDLLQKYPKMSEAWVQFGKLMLRRGQNMAALEGFQKAIAIDSKHGSAIIGRVDARLALGQKDQAVLELESLRSEKAGDPFILRTIGTVLLRTGEAERALEPLRMAYNIEPNSDITAMLLAQTQDNLGKIDEAIRGLLSHGEISSASVPIQMMYAGLMEKNKRPAEAIEVYEGVLKEHPRNTAALNNLAWALYLQGGRLNEALHYAMQANSIDTESVQIMDTLGVLLLANEKYAAALHTLKRAIRKNPENMDIALHYIQAMAKSSKEDEALEALALLLSKQRDWHGRNQAERLYQELKKEGG